MNGLKNSTAITKRTGSRPLPEAPGACICIDLKSFYASVECIERGLDPLTTNLVVADRSRTEKTICLAVSPSLKAWGISGRARLFEVVQRVKEVNAERLAGIPGHTFSGESADDLQLRKDPSLELSFISAVPRMAHYMQWSTRIYQIYLRYIAPEDIHVYSIDEVFIDAASYLDTYGLSGRELARKMILDVLRETGITATAGIGTNLYLAKIAMDIESKHTQPDENGVRIAELTEQSYRRSLWSHRPLTDFWRVGRGTARKLEENHLFTMGDIARCSLGKPADYHNEELLYRLFGVNAELLIDHAWGWEPCTIADIKAYKPESHSLGAGQILPEPYPFDKALLVLKEMADQLALSLFEKRLATDQLVLTVNYDTSNLSGSRHKKTENGSAGSASGTVVTDYYGRKVPKPAHGTIRLERYTSSSRLITRAASDLFRQKTDPKLFVRRLDLSAGNVVAETEARTIEEKAQAFEQLDLFTDYAAKARREKEEKAALERDKKLQAAMLSIRNKFGKNAVLKGRDLEEGATAMERNRQVGGHKA